MARQDRGMYRNPRQLRTPKRGAAGGTTGYQKNAPMPSAPMRNQGLLNAAAQARSSARKLPTGMPAMPATERVERPESTPMSRAPLRAAAVSRMDTQTPDPTAVRTEMPAPTTEGMPTVMPDVDWGAVQKARYIQATQQPAYKPGTKTGALEEDDPGGAADPEKETVQEAFAKGKKMPPDAKPIYSDITGEIIGYYGGAEGTVLFGEMDIDPETGEETFTQYEQRAHVADPYSTEDIPDDEVEPEIDAPHSEDTAAQLGELLGEEPGVSDEVKAAERAEMKKEFRAAVNRALREGALRRVGGAGAMLRGYGAVAGEFSTALSKKMVEQSKIASEEKSRRISNLIDLYGTQLDDETKKMLFSYQQEQDAWSDYHATIANHMEASGSKFRSGANTKLAMMFEKYVLGGKINKFTGAKWTTQDLINEFFMEWQGNIYWTGMGPDPTFKQDWDGYYFQFNTESAAARRAWGRTKEHAKTVAEKWGLDDYLNGYYDENGEWIQNTKTPPWKD